MLLFLVYKKFISTEDMFSEIFPILFNFITFYLFPIIIGFTLYFVFIPPLDPYTMNLYI